MASRADQMASGLNLSKFGQADRFEEAHLVHHRCADHFPLAQLRAAARRRSRRPGRALCEQRSGGVLDIFNTFSGGALERMSLIALGVMPYITASIVVQLAASLSPTLAAIKKEGESGRKKLNQYTRYGTVFLTAMQGYFLAAGLESLAAANGIQAVVEPGHDVPRWSRRSALSAAPCS